MSAFLLCFAAWSAIALGLDRHHEDATGREGAAHRLQQLRRAGWLLLLLSLNKIPTQALTCSFVIDKGFEMSRAVRDRGARAAVSGDDVGGRRWSAGATLIQLLQLHAGGRKTE